MDAPFAQSILKVEATDQDVVNSQSITYSIDTITQDFEIEPVTGIIRNKRLLLRVGPNDRIQTLTVQASDGEMTSTVQVTVSSGASSLGYLPVFNIVAWMSDGDVVACSRT